MDAAHYIEHETARDGRPVRIRALLPADRDAMLAAVGRMDSESLYRRFFGAKSKFSDTEIDYYTNVDFVRHVALVAEVQEAGTPLIAGGGRYVVTEAGAAELAFAVDDAHRGMGIGKLLMRHLAFIARSAGLHTLSAEVLADNAPMLAVFKASGLPMALHREGGVTRVDMRLDMEPRP